MVEPLQAIEYVRALYLVSLPLVTRRLITPSLF